MAVGPELRRGSYAIAHTVATATSRERTDDCSFPVVVRHLSRCFCSRVSALAQSTAGRILGTLTDQSGAAVAGATVVVTDVQRGTSRTITTDESGAYAAPDLQPGTYKIHVEAKGFKSVERANVQIEVATDVRADFALQPGQVTRNRHHHRRSSAGQHHLRHSGRHAQQQRDQRPAAERPQLREPAAAAARRDALSRRRFLHDQHRRPARRRQRLLHRGSVQQRAIFRTGHHQRRRHCGRFRDHPAHRRDPGIQRSGKSSRRIWMEAGSGHQRGIEVGNELAARHRVCLRPRRRHGRAQLLQRLARPENSPHPGAVWRQPGRRDH